MEVFPDVSMDPGIRFGKPCVIGTPIDVASVVGALSFAAIERDCCLTHELVLAALRYAAHVESHLPSGGEGCLVRILLDKNFPAPGLYSSNVATWRRAGDKRVELLGGVRDVLHFEVVPAADDGAPPRAVR